MNTLLRIGFVVSILSFFTGTYSQQFSISSRIPFLVEDNVPVIDSVSPKDLNNVPLISNPKANCHKGLRHFGREAPVLVNQNSQPGTYESVWDSTGFSSGIYYYRISAGNFTDTKKMVLMK